MKALLAAVLAAPLALFAAEGYRLDRSPHDPRDLVSLQSGARTFMNYCLGCHGLQFMRYDGLKELGLAEAQIKDNLMFSAEKVGEPSGVERRPVGIVVLFVLGVLFVFAYLLKKEYWKDVK